MDPVRNSDHPPAQPEITERIVNLCSDSDLQAPPNSSAENSSGGQPSAGGNTGVSGRVVVHFHFSESGWTEASLAGKAGDR